MDEFSLHVIGCGSALSMHGRHPSAQVITHGNFHCLIDCGEGTQDRLKQAGIKPFKIEVILISHLHGDHIFGLPGLLGSFSHLKRTEKLTIYGPVGLKGMLESIFSYSSMRFSYPLHIIENTPEGLESLWSKDDFEILTFPLNHRIPCNGYLLRELGVKAKFRKEQIEAYALSTDQIKAVERGEEAIIDGEKIPASEFLYPLEKPFSYAYCSDTRYDMKVIPWISGVSVLYHETTFMSEKVDLADLTGHSTAHQAAKIATKAGASCLMTGHYSSRYKDLMPLINEAKEIFNNVILAEEGKKYSLRSLANATNS
jgi:ribonuclease Z